MTEERTASYVLREQPDLAEPLYFAVVCRGRLEEFDELLKFLEVRAVRVTYRKRSPTYLWIVSANKFAEGAEPWN